MSTCPSSSSFAEVLSLPMLAIAAYTCIVLSAAMAIGFVYGKKRHVSQACPVVRDLFVYPIKGCGGIRVASAEVTPRGLAHDRMLMVVRELDGAFQTQRQLPRMATIRPFWNESGKLVLTAPGNPDFVLPADYPEDDAHRRVVRVWQDVVPDAVDCGDAVASWLSAALSTPDLRLVRMPDNHRRPARDDKNGEHVVSFADGFPLLLVTERSRESVRKHAEIPALAMERFRPNVVIDGNNMKPFEENNWAEITVGDTAFKVPKPCDRCQVPRIDQSTGTPDSLPNKQPTAALRTLTKNRFGVNLLPVTAGVCFVRIGDRVCLSRKRF
ncbi:unnamed protein product [Agarophyton chilense]|eukprot:gb/GEZJ01002260.1/.p1 GENE.gb/GEZJ01002260.1/~~gb/GEZJ01002260.1/.p1  ORF type:complete len:326 (-),score=16.51 gb/GEZJ01002260.1/:242-1219(-)